MIKVAFVISHPIQYYVPLLKLLTNSEFLDIKVFYTWGEGSITKFDPGFNKIVNWDIPLLEGYNYEFLNNIAKNPGTHHFNGIDNPNIFYRINSYKPDKLVVFGWSFKSHLKILRYFKGKIPIYFRGDSHLLNNQSIFKMVLRKLFLTWVYSHIDFAIAVGTKNKDYYKWVGLKDSQILFAPHAVDENRFVNVEIDQNEDSNNLLNSLNIPSKNVVFLYTGKFEYRKDLQTLIKAKIELKDLPCTLILVGNGPDEQSLKQLSIGDSNIHFIDFANQSKMPRIYKSADVFILPSISETWGLGINEAMNCGLAIIASDKVGAAHDLVKKNGFVFKAGDYKELSESMKILINDKRLLNNFKKNSTELIKYWSIKRQAAEFEKILAG